MTHLMGEKHLSAVSADNPEPLASVAGVGLAADPLMKLDTKRRIPADRSPTDVGALEALIPWARLASDRGRRTERRQAGEESNQR
jgi:hypothetical protein